MALLHSFRRSLRHGASTSDVSAPDQIHHPADQPLTAGPQVEIAASDPLLAYLQSAPGPVDLVSLDLDSTAVRDLRQAGIALVVPLISQGELIGTLNLGPRLSEQEYSDRKSVV